MMIDIDRQPDGPAVLDQAAWPVHARAYSRALLADGWDEATLRRLVRVRGVYCAASFGFDWATAGRLAWARWLYTGGQLVP